MSERLKVFRVENIDRIGPYWSERLHSYKVSCVLDAHGYPTHPSPSCPGEPWHSFTRAGHVFGFLYLDDLYRWFPEKLVEDMRECGFRISVYEIADSHLEHMGLGDSGQICWHPDYAEFVSHLN